MKEVQKGKRGQQKKLKAGRFTRIALKKLEEVLSINLLRIQGVSYVKAMSNTSQPVNWGGLQIGR